RRHKRSIVTLLFVIAAYVLLVGAIGKILTVRPRLEWHVPDDKKGILSSPLCGFSPNGQWLATCTFEDGEIAGPIRIWKTSTGQEHTHWLQLKDHLLRGLPFGRACLEFTPDSQKLVVVLAPKNADDRETTLKIYDIPRRREVARLLVRPFEDFARNKARHFC